MILNNNKEIPKIINHKSEMNKNGNDKYNNNYIETPHFALNPKTLNGVNRAKNYTKKNLNLLPLTYLGNLLKIYFK